MSKKKYWLTRDFVGYELYLSVKPPKVTRHSFIGTGRIFFAWPYRFHAISKIRLKKKQCIELTGEFGFKESNQ